MKDDPPDIITTCNRLCSILQVLMGQSKGTPNNSPGMEFTWGQDEQPLKKGVHEGEVETGETVEGGEDGKDDSNTPWVGVKNREPTVGNDVKEEWPVLLICTCLRCF